MSNIKKEIPYKIYLEESEMPKEWYNVRADMKNKPAPLLNPKTYQPMTEAELGQIFCEELVKQELDTTTPFIEIPEEIRNFYKMYRPSPLVRAYCLEEKLQTPAKIYYKFTANQRIIAENAQFTGIAAGQGVGFTTGLLHLRKGLGMRETPIRPHS